MNISKNFSKQLLKHLVLLVSTWFLFSSIYVNFSTFSLIAGCPVLDSSLCGNERLEQQVERLLGAPLGRHGVPKVLDSSLGKVDGLNDIRMVVGKRQRHAEFVISWNAECINLPPSL